ncbi:MAG: Ig-like domain-containing protein [Bryobacteraceae bacterium]
MFKRGYLSFIAASLMLMASTGLCRAQVATQLPTEHSASREAWRASMSRRPLPRKGCFRASYPSTEWKEVPCSTAKPPLLLPPPGRRGGEGSPENVGNGNSNDFAAEVSGTIVTAVGSFNTITPGTTESDTGTSDSFSLQINSRPFTTSVCSGIVGCQGWQQFAFANNSPPPYCTCVFIQYWLLNYGASCPAGWSSLWGIHCYTNSSATDVTGVPTADLAGLTLTGTATGGMDTVILAPGSDLIATGTDSTLNLEDAWNVAEFNVFGVGSGSQAVFSSGTTIVVKTSVDDGTTNQPTCLQQSYTGETNNLNLANTTGMSTLVCCPYGGASPNIQFMETNAGHTGSCGATHLVGDPHITTADGTHYDFQSAGEFVSLRDPDEEEIQTRQTPVSTTFIGTDAYDGLTTCVSLNTAVAARVGGHRVTYEPNLSGVPDPSGLQLRIDGVLTVLGPAGRDLGNGGRVFKSSTGGNLEIDFPSGKTLLVTPGWWASQGKWYLNVDVTHLGLVGGGASARGIAGPIADGSWLPALPNGASLGPMPGPLQDRYVTLYRKFADAWRVTNKDSLFDYAPGTSTGTFTMREWPLQSAPCVVPNTKPVEPASQAVAEAVCRRVWDRNMHADCVFDVRATGNPGFAKVYLDAQRTLADSTSTSLTDNPDPSQAGEWVTFTAFVAPHSSTARGFPSGTVQFAVDGSNVGEPVKVDAKGRATWETSRLKVGTHRVTASYVPGADSTFLPSTSLERLHVVKRCHCDAERELK